MQQRCGVVFKQWSSKKNVESRQQLRSSEIELGGVDKRRVDFQILTISNTSIKTTAYYNY